MHAWMASVHVYPADLRRDLYGFQDPLLVQDCFLIRAPTSMHACKDCLLFFLFTLSLSFFFFLLPLLPCRRMQLNLRGNQTDNRRTAMEIVDNDLLCLDKELRWEWQLHTSRQVLMDGGMDTPRLV